MPKNNYNFGFRRKLVKIAEKYDHYNDPYFPSIIFVSFLLNRRSSKFALKNNCSNVLTSANHDNASFPNAPLQVNDGTLKSGFC
jgi:hypothetical protein